MILSSTYVHGDLTQEETNIVSHTLDLTELSVAEVMRQREDMVMLEVDADLETILTTVLNTHYSRYPIYAKDKNNVLGIVHIKDLFSALYAGNKDINLKLLLRPILKVHYNLPAIDLLTKFREGKPHFALIYKEQDILGFVTLDNLLHILFGHIKDEFHRTQDDWKKLADGSLLVRGGCSIYSLERALNKAITLTLDEAELDTLAGLLIERSGTLPQKGERIEFPEFAAIIEEIHGNFIHEIKIIPKK